MPIIKKLGRAIIQILTKSYTDCCAQLRTRIWKVISKVLLHFLETMKQIFWLAEEMEPQT